MTDVERTMLEDACDRLEALEKSIGKRLRTASVRSVEQVGKNGIELGAVSAIRKALETLG